jgi:hypothetical protein
MTGGEIPGASVLTATERRSQMSCGVEMMCVRTPYRAGTQSPQAFHRQPTGNRQVVHIQTFPNGIFSATAGLAKHTEHHEASHATALNNIAGGGMRVEAPYYHSKRLYLIPSYGHTKGKRAVE